jgi:hypothetical protein
MVLIVDVTNEVLTYIETAHPELNILSTYPSTTPVFPCVVLEEKTNNQLKETVDSAGEHHSDVMIEVNIFTQGDTKISDAKAIRKKIDDIMSGYYKMGRTYSGTVSNFVDTNVHRYTLRYSFIVNANRMIYRG